MPYLSFHDLGDTPRDANRIRCQHKRLHRHAVVTVAIYKSGELDVVCLLDETTITRPATFVNRPTSPVSMRPRRLFLWYVLCHRYVGGGVGIRCTL